MTRIRFSIVGLLLSLLTVSALGSTHSDPVQAGVARRPIAGEEERDFHKAAQARQKSWLAGSHDAGIPLQGHYQKKDANGKLVCEAEVTVRGYDWLGRALILFRVYDSQTTGYLETNIIGRSFLTSQTQLTVVERKGILGVEEGTGTVQADGDGRYSISLTKTGWQSGDWKCPGAEKI